MVAPVLAALALAASASQIAIIIVSVVVVGKLLFVCKRARVEPAENKQWRPWFLLFMALVTMFLFAGQLANIMQQSGALG